MVLNLKTVRTRGTVLQHEGSPIWE